MVAVNHDKGSGMLQRNSPNCMNSKHSQVIPLNHTSIFSTNYQAVKICRLSIVLVLARKEGGHNLNEMWRLSKAKKLTSVVTSTVRVHPESQNLGKRVKVS